MKTVLTLLTFIIFSNVISGQTDNEYILELKKQRVKSITHVDKYNIFKKQATKYRYEYLDNKIIKYEESNLYEYETTTFF